MANVNPNPNPNPNPPSASDGLHAGNRRMPDYRGNQGWERCFEVIIPQLIYSTSDVSQSHPLLHQVVGSRYDESWLMRNRRMISRCPHRYEVVLSDNTRKRRRSDSRDYQENGPKRIHGGMPIKYANRNHWRHSKMCRDLRNRVEVVGRIGSGSYGTVFLAHEPAGNNNPTHDLTYAIKVMDHQYLHKSLGSHQKPEMVPIMEGGRLRLIPREAMVMHLSSGSKRFPKLDSVYTDDQFISVVMSACVDYPMTQEEVPDRYKKIPWEAKTPSFCGDFLMHNKKTLLDEIEACKVSSQLLEGMAYHRDMNLSYDDLSHFNYLLDQSLNVQMIDFGLMKFGLVESDFDTNRYTYLFYQEYQITPELGVEMSKPTWREMIKDSDYGQVTVFLPNDARQSHLWKYAVIVHGLLHGFAPWEDPEWIDEIDKIEHFARAADSTRDNYDRGPRWEAAYERRKRMVNEELPLREDLSQDCVDALRVMLHRDPVQRPRLSELESFPWFGQWAYHTDRSFNRPESREYRRALRQSR